MAAGSTRSFVINRAVAADKWLTSHLGTTLPNADANALEQYLESLPESLRDRSWDALIVWGDDMIRRGAAIENAARTLRVEIDLRDTGIDIRDHGPGDSVAPRRPKVRRR